MHLSVVVSADFPAEAWFKFGIVGTFNYDAGTEFERCASAGAVVAPKAAGEGDGCQISPSRPCAAGLACDLAEPKTAASDFNEGVCVDPNEQVADQAAGELCGGARKVGCQPGLECAYLSKAGFDRGAIGQCRAAVGQKYDPCGGYPEASCADGLFCVGRTRNGLNKECVEADGDLHARCGEDLPECQQGFVCAAGHCTDDLASDGESCAPETKRRCSASLVCDPATLTCVSSNAPERQPLDSECASDDGCQRGLVCRDGVCSNPLPGGVDAECQAAFQCETDLVCRDGACAEAGTGDIAAQCDSEFDCRPELDCIKSKCAHAAGTGIVGAFCGDAFDCNGGLICKDDLCSTPSPDDRDGAAVCSRDRDCAEGFVCTEAGVCGLPVSTTSGCSSDFECDAGMICEDSLCVETNSSPEF
jgi:hypothetical protein